MEEVKNVIFSVAGQSFGLSIMEVRGIERQMNIVSVPNRPSSVLGIINLRGDIIPVYSLRDRFGKEDYADKESNIIITSTNGVTMALKVDSVDEIVDIPEEKKFDLPELVVSENTAYIDKVASVDKKIVLLLNMDGIVSEADLDEIEQMMENV